MFRTPFRWAKELIEKFFLSELNFLNSSVHSERTVWKVQFARKNCSISLILSKKKKKNQFYSFSSFKKNCSKRSVRSKELFDRSVRRIELLKQFISSERKLNLGTPMNYKSGRILISLVHILWLSFNSRETIEKYQFKWKIY